MGAATDDEATWDLRKLPHEVGEALGELKAQRTVTLRDGDELLGTVRFTPTVLEGRVLDTKTGTLGPRQEVSPHPPRHPGDVTVVATGTKLTDQARARLSESLGGGYIVVDIAQAPPTADVVLVHAVSPQLIGLLAANFPQARILVIELLDDDLHIDVRGPVGRLLDAGAHAYLSRGPVEQVGHSVRRVLENPPASELEQPDERTGQTPQVAARPPQG